MPAFQTESCEALEELFIAIMANTPGRACACLASGGWKKRSNVGHYWVKCFCYRLVRDSGARRISIAIAQFAGVWLVQIKGKKCPAESHYQGDVQIWRYATTALSGAYDGGKIIDSCHQNDGEQQLLQGDGIVANFSGQSKEGYCTIISLRKRSRAKKFMGNGNVLTQTAAKEGEACVEEDGVSAPLAAPSHLFNFH